MIYNAWIPVGGGKNNGILGDHAQEYASFAKGLEDAGKIESARHLKDMIALSARSTECLKKAMKALG